MRKTTVISFLVASLTLYAEEQKASTWNCQNLAHSHFLELRHQEGKGIGYTGGYSSADLLLSETPPSFLTPFLDLRGHYFNNGKYAANAGFGLRDSSEVLGVAFGINAFYDIRKVKHAHFQQVGPGIEVLGEQWDFRANGYFPIGKRRKVLSSKIVTSHGFSFLQKKIEYNFIGGNAEIGRSLAKNGAFACKLAGGGYYLKGLFHKKAAGGYLKLSGRLSPFIGYRAQGSYDALFRWRGFGELALILPFGRSLFSLKAEGCPRGHYLPNEHFLEQVSRFEIIPSHTQKKRTRT